jgi:CO/xanthine dehydrogenase Mo-binding subunit
MSEPITRREFIKYTMKFAGGSMVLSCLPITACTKQRLRQTPESFPVTEEIPSTNWAPVPGKAGQRIEGLEKVTGQKIFARDFYARDFTGWPDTQRFAYYLRASNADQVFSGINLKMLPKEYQPVKVIYGEDIADKFTQTKNVLYDLLVEKDFELERLAVTRGKNANTDKGVVLPRDLKYPLIVSRGNVADFLGQPIALLIFSDFNSFTNAKKILQFNPNVVSYKTKSTKLAEPALSPVTNYVRIAGTDGKDKFSYVLNGYDKDYDAQADARRVSIEKEFTDKTTRHEWLADESDYDMQAMDPMFMEPESGLGWYDNNNKILTIVVGTQSPDHDLQDVATMFTDPDSPITPREVQLVSCYPGGGFGGRDKSVFSLLLSLACAYADGPVRLAYDRFEQFQSGLKRHACRIKQRVAIDKQGKIQTIITDLKFDSGGRKNLSPYVANLAGLCAGGSYIVPKSAINSYAYHSINVSGGSQRGFGGPQAFYAIETALDNLARIGNQDPIALRANNLLEKDQRTVVGGPVNERLRLKEICDIARNQEIWTQKNTRQSEFKQKGIYYGVGFALSNQAYGTSGDGMLGFAGINMDGTLTVKTNAVDMGNGSATTLAITTAQACGINARNVVMGDAASFDQLQLTVKCTPAKPNEKCYTDWNNPRWVKKISGSSSACLTAFHQVHAIEQASNILYSVSLLPAAHQIWGRKPAEAKWQNSQLTAPGLPGLTTSQLAAHIYKNNGYTGAMVHAYFQAKWVSADYQVNQQNYHWPIDALGLLKPGSSPVELINRSNTQPPSEESARFSRTTFAPCGNLIALTINPAKDFKVEILDCISILNAGPLLVPQLVEGQSQGGVAMAIGYTLMENAIAGADGPGGGQWNLNRYHVPLYSDIPLKQKLITLPPRQGEQRAKGIAEAVMCSVAPAIANAMLHATGKVFRSLPITADKIKKALT